MTNRIPHLLDNIAADGGATFPTLSVSGAVALDGTLVVGGAATFNGALSVVGTFGAPNTVTLGETTADKVTTPEFWLSDTVFEDLRFPATAINPPGQAADPDWDVTKSGWLFGASGTERLYLIAQLPHAWKEGTVLRPHVHWERTTSASGAVFWQLKYQWAPYLVQRIAEVTINETSPLSNSDVLDTPMITALADIAGTSRSVSDMLVMQLERIGGNAADTYGADARLLEFDIHYEVDALGSRTEYTK